MGYFTEMEREFAFFVDEKPKTKTEVLNLMRRDDYEIKKPNLKRLIEREIIVAEIIDGFRKYRRGPNWQQFDDQYGLETVKSWILQQEILDLIPDQKIRRPSLQ